MSLVHEFFLLPNDFNHNERYEWYYNNRGSWENKVEVKDDIVTYLMDYFNWVPTFNPETNKIQYGLNYHGVTFIYSNGANKLLRILTRWNDLLDEGPEIISFKGPTVWREEDNGDTYLEETRIKVSKKEYLTVIHKLNNLLNQVTDDKGYIMHFGL